VRRYWSPSGVPGSTWCLGWDRPAATGSSAGTRWPRTGVGHLGFTGCSIWIDPPRARWVVLLSNRVHPTRANDRIKSFRPRLHGAIVEALDGPAPRRA
jgi:CubicO group peptidase (beta-lactamase class C family)